jgi:hypothetical protein
MAGNHPKDGGFSAAGRTEQAAIGPVRDVNVHAVNGVDKPVKAFDDSG